MAVVVFEVLQVVDAVRSQGAVAEEDDDDPTDLMAFMVVVSWNAYILHN